MMVVTFKIKCEDISDLLNHLDAIKGQINESARSRRLMGDSDLSEEMAKEVNSKFAEEYMLQGSHETKVSY
jgi:hypothetical protein